MKRSQTLSFQNSQGEEIRYSKTSSTIDGNEVTSWLERYTDPNGNILKKQNYLESNSIFEEFEHPNGLKESREINMAQNSMKIINRNEKELSFTYDKLRRRKSFSHATGENQCTYDYRKNSNMLQMAGAQGDQFGTVFVDYNDQFQVTQVRMKGSYFQIFKNKS